MQAHTTLDSIVLILKSKLTKGCITSGIAKPGKLLPLSPGFSQALLGLRSVSKGLCPRLRKTSLPAQGCLVSSQQGPDKPISCRIILQSCSTLFAAIHMPPCSFT